jgi:GH18 family chitinase
MHLTQTIKKLTKLLFITPLFLHATLIQPANLQLNPTHDSVTLTWQDTNTQESGYKIFRNGILIAFTPADEETFVDTNLKPNTFYRYSVKATDEVGDVVHTKREKIVFGYYHFHEMNATTDAAIDWDQITHVGWHFVQLMKDTPSELFTYLSYDDKPIWPTKAAGEGLNDPQLSDVKNRLDMLHAKGIKVYLGVMAEHRITKDTLGDKTWRTAAINALIESMLLGGADGLDIDIENQAVEIDENNLVDAQEKLENLYLFIRELRVALDSRELYDKAIHIAAPIHFAYLNAFANSPVKKILDIVDSYFVMGYDTKWTPNASAHALFRWSQVYADKDATYASDYGWSYLRAIAELTRGIDSRLRSKIILGVPYYTYEYLTDSGDFAAEKVKGFVIDSQLQHAWAGRDISYDSIEQIIQARDLTVHRDAGTYTPWISWKDDTDSTLWHQVYYEDSTSLSTKYRFMREQSLGGTGMWSLGEHQSTEFSRLLQENFHSDVPPQKGSKENPIMIESTPYHDTKDTTDGTSYFNYYAGRCDNNKAMYGFEYVYQITLAQKGRLQLSLSIPNNQTKLGLQLLDNIDEKSCIAQSDTTLLKILDAGIYYIVVDTQVINMVDKRGSYTLNVDFTPQ